MTVTQITDHAAQALATMSNWTEGKERIRKLVEILADQVQLLEDVIDDVITNSLLSNAAGVILDEYGDIFDELRGNLTDAQYENLLNVVIAAHQSDGGAYELIRLATLLIGCATQYFQAAPADYHLVYFPATPITGDWLTAVSRVLEIMRPAGVTHALVEGDPSTPFTLDQQNLDYGKLATRHF